MKTFWSLCGLIFAIPLLSSNTENIHVNMRLTHQLCTVSPDGMRQCPEYASITEPIEFELNEKPTVRLVDKKGYAMVSLAKTAGGYKLNIDIYNIKEDSYAFETTSKTFELIDIENPSMISKQVFMTDFYDFDWDAQRFSSRTVLVIGGSNTRKLQTPVDRYQKLLKTLIKKDPSIKVSKVGLNKSGFEINIISKNNYAQSIATIFAGKTEFNREAPYVLKRRVFDGHNKMLTLEYLPKDIFKIAGLFNSAFAENILFAHTKIENNKIIISVKDTQLKIGEQVFSAEEIFNTIFCSSESNILTNIPLGTPIKIATQYDSEPLPEQEDDKI